MFNVISHPDDPRNIHGVPNGFRDQDRLRLDRDFITRPIREGIVLRCRGRGDGARLYLGRPATFEAVGPVARPITNYIRGHYESWCDFAAGIIDPNEDLRGPIFVVGITRATSYVLSIPLDHEEKSPARAPGTRIQITRGSRQTSAIATSDGLLLHAHCDSEQLAGTRGHAITISWCEVKRRIYNPHRVFCV